MDLSILVLILPLGLLVTGYIFYWLNRNGDTPDSGKGADGSDAMADFWASHDHND